MILMVHVCLHERANTLLRMCFMLALMGHSLCGLVVTRVDLITNFAKWS
jgi:hypothetical protein